MLPHSDPPAPHASPCRYQCLVTAAAMPVQQCRLDLYSLRTASLITRVRASLSCALGVRSPQDCLTRSQTQRGPTIAHWCARLAPRTPRPAPRAPRPTPRGTHHLTPLVLPSPAATHFDFSCCSLCRRCGCAAWPRPPTSPSQSMRRSWLRLRRIRPTSVGTPGLPRLKRSCRRVFSCVHLCV